jgi:hypothetical protein
MKTSSRGLCRGWFLTLAALCLFAAGCATQRVDWNSRIGTYTYDDAVRELGPPYKQAELSDKSLVADWITGRGARTATTLGGGFYHPYGPYWAGPSVVVVDPPYPDRLLRLTFDPQRRLVDWKRVYQ